jgi:hypothetical protein
MTYGIDTSRKIVAEDHSRNRTRNRGQTTMSQDGKGAIQTDVELGVKGKRVKGARLDISC